MGTDKIPHQPRIDPAGRDLFGRLLILFLSV